MNQWHWELSQGFGGTVGLLGGGDYDFQPLTVTTYDSAYIHLERWGNRFGLVVFDECHHLPGPTYAMAAVGSLAPFRLGLTATPERADGMEQVYPELIGPIVYRREIKELSGDFLAEYRTERIYVELTAEEQERYQAARDTYRRFVFDRNISMSGPNGWQRFIFEASRSPEGWAAFRAYREQKRLERAAGAKLQLLEELLTQARGRPHPDLHRRQRHRLPDRPPVPRPGDHAPDQDERTQADPRTVPLRRVPDRGDQPGAQRGRGRAGGERRHRPVGHQHDPRERPAARPAPAEAQGKQAVLYEVVARGTAEEFASDRRRQHHAFQ